MIEHRSEEHERQMADLDTKQLHGKSLLAWYKWLTWDDREDAPSGHLQVPCSRYGDNGYECAWWALAAEVAYVEANGEDDEPETSLDHLMGLVVNDSPEIAALVFDYWDKLPYSLRAQMAVSRMEVGLLL